MKKRNTLVGPQLQLTGNGINWHRGWFLLLPIAIGMVAATQFAAHSLDYDRALGPNFYRLYPPWGYFVWSGLWSHINPHLFQKAAGAGVLAILGSLLLLIMLIHRTTFRVNPFLHGSARWADERDIKAAGLLNNNGVYVGAWRDKRGTIRYLRHNGPEHILCYAPTRSGKGVGLVVPTLLSWTESVFVTDLKGELYELTAGWRQEHAHNKVLRFEPAASSGSCCFNPIAELRIGTEHEVGDVQNLALLMVDPEGQGLRPGDHWQKTAHSLLVGCILHLCYKSRHDGSPATFAALGQMLSDPKRPITDLWAEMLCFPHINGANHPVVGASARDMVDRPPNEAGSVLSTTKSYLDLFRDPTIAKNTSRSDFRILELMNYVDPISLYIVTKPNDKARLKPLVRIVVNMIVRLLADKLDFENGRPKPSYKHRLLAMIDEFPALGKLEILQESLAFVAGYGIKCYLISQDINQLKSRETGYGPDETITSNCHIQTAFPPNRLDTAEHLSKLTGQTTLVKEQVTKSQSGRGMGVQVSRAMQEVQRPLLTPDECLRMPGPQKNERDLITAAGDMVVYCAGFPAIYGRQPLYFQDATFAARAKIPPPKHSDSLSSLPVPDVQIL
jgi:type IV secretion system protein VirD4